MSRLHGTEYLSGAIFVKKLLLQVSESVNVESTNVTDRRTDGQTDRQATCDRNASRGKNGKWLPILLSVGKRQHSISFVYRYYHLPMPDPSPSTLTV